jgi:hypothetical protein
MWQEWGRRGTCRKARRKETIRKTKMEVVANIKMDLVEVGWGSMD